MTKHFTPISPQLPFDLFTIINIHDAFSSCWPGSHSSSLLPPSSYDSICLSEVQSEESFLSENPKLFPSQPRLSKLLIECNGAQDHATILSLLTCHRNSGFVRARSTPNGASND